MPEDDAQSQQKQTERTHHKSALSWVLGRTPSRLCQEGAIHLRCEGVEIWHGGNWGGARGGLTLLVCLENATKASKRCRKSGFGRGVILPPDGELNLQAVSRIPVKLWILRVTVTSTGCAGSIEGWRTYSLQAENALGGSGSHFSQRKREVGHPRVRALRSRAFLLRSAG